VVIAGEAAAQEDNFTNETLSGSYAVLGTGVTGDSIVTLVGVAEPDGAGTLSIDLDVSNFNINTNAITTDTVTSTGTYQVENDGRITATVSDLSNNIRLYMASEKSAAMLTLDQSQIIVGRLRKRVE